MRLIDADDFNKRLENPPYTIYDGEMLAEWYKECLKTQSTIEAEPVRHGRWNGVGKVFSEDWACSNCGHTKGKGSGRNFCGNCGAKMDGDTDDET